MDCSLWGSSIHGILQARVLERIAISFSRGSSRPRDRTRVSSIANRQLYQLSHQGSSPVLLATNPNTSSEPLDWAIDSTVWWEEKRSFSVTEQLRFFFLENELFLIFWHYLSSSGNKEGVPGQGHQVIFVNKSSVNGSDGQTLFQELQKSRWINAVSGHKNLAVKVAQSCTTLSNPTDYIQVVEYSRPEHWGG